jgi:N6-adenosine-specific RNA methylase IME4
MTWDGLNPPYSTIVADPPWRYEKGHARIPTTAKKRRPNVEAQYSTLALHDLCAMDVASLMDENAHLYLWVTNPVLPQAGAVVEAWGFRYVTCLTWLKEGTLGLGYHFRIDTEHVLFGVKGKLPIPPEKRERNWFAAAKRGHSVKPASFYDLVERVSPGPYLELFARQPRLGWDSWGYGFEEAS